jgi:Phospholipase B
MIMRTIWVLALAAAAFAAPVPPDWSKWEAIRGSASLDNNMQRDGRATLRIESGGASDAIVRSAPVSLTIGKTYELSGWVRTGGLAVRDVDRSPVAVGATLAMASMPFDVHSESVAGTHGWTRVAMKFTAARSRDEITLRVAEGGAFAGQAWFDGVNLDEASGAGSWPVKAAVKTFGPAYRYPKAGWVYLHIEGAPYERGYQHGYLMAKEIEGYIDRCAAVLNAKSRQDGWSGGRTATNSLFLRGFDEEILTEMRGIADGAAAAGCKYNGKKVDLVDIATANVTVELGELHHAVEVMATGLEMLGFKPPVYFDRNRDVPANDRCSAFAATGKATRDGHMVIAHTTWWPLTLAEQTNVMLDIQPKTGHRILMQSYPGGIESGTDWYQNDAGVVLTETTIGQTPFNRDGTPVAYRARKAIQYGGNVDEVVRYLSTKNNGLYTNEWLIGDGKNDEIAMFELGTYKTKLWRSSKNEWFAGAEGFYWGNNNAKDVDVRLEAMAMDGAPERTAFSPAPRDVKWLELYDKHKGRIDEQFAFLAFRTAPLVSSAAMDAKVATAEMASNMMVWAEIGKPNQREWLPGEWGKRMYEKNDGLFPAGYALFDARASDALRAIVAENERERTGGKRDQLAKPDSHRHNVAADLLWRGQILPASDADLWLTEGGAAYYHALNSDRADDLDVLRTDYAFAAAAAGETPLRDIKADMRSREWAAMAGSKGALLLDALRERMGDEKFFAVMKTFYEQHAGKPASSSEFRQAAEHAFGHPLADLFSEWVDRTGLPGGLSNARYPALLGAHLASAMIVYGTMGEAGSNRYAAEQVQQRFLNWLEHEIPIRKDFEVIEAEMKSHDIVFVGRPETNSALAAWAGKLGLSYDGAGFRVDGKDYFSEYDSLVVAGVNPLDPKRLVVVLAGNTALQTVKTVNSFPPQGAEFTVYQNGESIASGFRHAITNPLPAPQ